MFYRLQFEEDTNGTILVTFPDLPWIQTFGDTKAKALENAEDALVTGLAYMMKTRQPIPEGTPGIGDDGIFVPALLASKIALHNELLKQGVNRAELGRRLKIHRPQVDRLVDVRHSSRMEQLEAAFAAVGRRVDVRVIPAEEKAAARPMRRVAARR